MNSSPNTTAEENNGTAGLRTTEDPATGTMPGAANEPRENNGRFAKGNRGGPGNPFARQTALLRQAMLDAVTPEDMQAVICAMKKKAADGDVPAAKLLMSYCIGKPTAAENPDTINLHELKTIMANHLDSAEGPLNIIKGMPLDIIIEMFRLILPILRSEKVKMAKDVLCAPLTEDEIEDNRVDDEEDDSTSSSSTTEPARDPMENIPQWMRDIGSEPEQPAPKRAGKGKKRKKAKPTEAPKPSEPVSQPTVDSDLLRILLERARQLKAANPSLTADDPATAQAAKEIAELLKSRNGQHPPSANGVNGRK